MGKVQLKFSLSLVAVIALIAIVVGVVAGRASGGSTDKASAGSGKGGAAAGKKVDVIIKASDSSFWQTMLAGSSRAVHARASVRLATGNAGSTRLAVGGRDLGIMGKDGETLRDVEFTK